MRGITSAGIRAALTSGPDNRALRISKHTGDITTAKHGFFSRMVRLFGPTRQDKADNRAIRAAVKEHMASEYRELAVEGALRRMSRLGDDLGDHLETPLLTRQVRTARAFARNSLDAHAKSQFAEISRRIHKRDFGKDSESAFLRIRLLDELRDSAYRNGKVPGEREAEAIAKQFRAQVVQLGEATDKVSNNIADLREVARKLVQTALGEDGDRGTAIARLGEMATASDRLTGIYDDGSGIGDDQHYVQEPARLAMQWAISLDTPTRARELIGEAMREGSTMRALLATVARGKEQSDARSHSATMAAEEFQEHLRSLIVAVGQRAGLPTEKTEETANKLLALDAQIRDDGPDRDLSGDERRIRRDYEKQLEKRGPDLLRRWAAENPEKTKRRVDKAVREVLTHFDPVKKTEAFEKAVPRWVDLNSLDTDRRRLVRERLRVSLQTTGNVYHELPARNLISAIVGGAVQSVARMEDREVQSELALIEAQRVSAD